MPSWLVLQYDLRTTTHGRITDSDRLSDHIPVVSGISRNDLSLTQTTPPIPLWVTKDTFFPIALSSEMNKVDFSTLSTAASVLQLKNCIRRAGKCVSDRALRRGAESNEEKLYWALSCARAMFNGHSGSIMHANCAYSYLSTFVLLDIGLQTICCLDLEGLGHHISDLMAHSLELARANIIKEADNAQQVFRVKLRSIDRLSQLWATKGRKASLAGARDEKGQVFTEPQAAADIFEIRSFEI